jgi:hypothetical protein
MAMIGLTMVGLLTGGCFESNDTYVLNPDGSGKVTRMVLFQPPPDQDGLDGMSMSMSVNGGKVSSQKPGSGKTKKTPAEQALALAGDELRNSSGIEVWKDVKAYPAKDGRLCFIGTAYFKDLSGLSFHNAGCDVGLAPSLTNDAKGNLILDVRKPNDGEDGKDGDAEVAGKGGKAEPKKAMTADEVKKAIAEQRSKYQQAKPMMSMLLSTLKMKMIFRLPGKVERSTNFKKDAVGNLCLSYEGNKMIEVVDVLIRDDKWMAEQVKAGADFESGGPSMDAELNKKMFGEAGPIRAVMAKSGTPLFNYAAEVAVAKVAYPAVLKEFGATEGSDKGPFWMSAGKPAAPAAAPATGGAMKNVQSTDVSISRGENASCRVSVSADLPGSVAALDEGLIEKAVTDNGENVLPDKDFFKQISFPHLSENKSSVDFSVELKPPTRAAKSIKELTGYLTCVVASGTKTVDLGFNGLKDDARGKVYDAHIWAVKPLPWDAGKTSFTVSLDLPKKSVKAVKLLDSTGKPLETEQGGSSFSGESCSVTLNVKGKLPADGRLMLELYDNVKEFRSPFALKDVALP